MTFLVSERIKLMKFTEDFIIPKYIGWLNDSSVNRYLCTGRLPVAKADMFAPKDDKNLLFAVMSNVYFENGIASTDTDYCYYIGTISLHGIDWISRKGEVGYMLGDQQYWGGGFATEAVGLITNYGFNRLGLNKLYAGVVDGNIGSCKVLENNGYKLLAVNPQDYYLEGKYLDTHMYYKLQGWK